MRGCAGPIGGFRTAFNALLLISSAVLSACAHPGPPAPWVNSLGMPFVSIPAGEFEMGSDDDPAAMARAFPMMEAERFADLGDERPRHRVRISRAFWQGQHEVTVVQYRRYLSASAHRPESVADGTGGYGYRADHDPATYGPWRCLRGPRSALLLG